MKKTPIYKCEVDVRDEHIRDGVKFDTKECALSLALNDDECLSNAFVKGMHVIADFEKGDIRTEVEAHVGSMLRFWYGRFDEGLKVAPVKDSLTFYRRRKHGPHQSL